jgi:hypothetical protein
VPLNDAACDVRKTTKISRVFVETIDRTGAQRPNGELMLTLSAYHDDRRRIMTRRQFAKHAQPVDVWHDEIEKENIVSVLFHRLQTPTTGGHVIEQAIFAAAFE